MSSLPQLLIENFAKSVVSLVRPFCEEQALGSGFAECTTSQATESAIF
jgi:hypothetical protein